MPTSAATKRNWERLSVSPEGRLTTRANKQRSLRRVVPVEYMRHKDSVALLLGLAEFIDARHIAVGDCLFTVAMQMLSAKGLSKQPHVRQVLAPYENKWNRTEALDGIDDVLFQEEDPLGVLYQCLLTEGDKNRLGSYYTPPAVVHAMTEHLDFSAGQTFYDPCCGSGVFLVSLRHVHPQQIFGGDVDPYAVFIAKINMLIRFPDDEFIPQIECADYTGGASLWQSSSKYAGLPMDYICTNPPWGAVTCGRSGESFAAFVSRALDQVKVGGVVDMLLPESVLNINVHSPLRRFLLEKCRLLHVQIHDFRFTGVQTGVVDIAVAKSSPAPTVMIRSSGGSRKMPTSAFSVTEQCVFSPWNADELDVLHFIRNTCPLSLRESKWALGIVTGDNKGKLHDSPVVGTEPIYTGKDVHPFCLSSPTHFIRFCRAELQQVAPDAFYRAPEKLVYKFICDRPVFAYDDAQVLVLNSANVLLPCVPGMETLTVLAFLNSEVLRFLYFKLFGGCVKVLKSNLCCLPLPRISPDLNSYIASLARHCIVRSSSSDLALQGAVYAAYGLSQSHILTIKNYLYGET